MANAYCAACHTWHPYGAMHADTPAYAAYLRQRADAYVAGYLAGYAAEQARLYARGE